VDWRMTEGPPPANLGYYFSPYEVSTSEGQTLPSIALRKFAASPCARLVYASGPIQIFDVAGIENGSCEPGTVGTGHGKRRYP
jgi:hypothetical protein